MMKRPIFTSLAAAAFFAVSSTAAYAAEPPTPQPWTLEADIDAQADVDVVHAQFGSPETTGGTEYFLQTELLTEEGDNQAELREWGTTLYFDPDQTYNTSYEIPDAELAPGTYVVRQSVYVAYMSDDPADNGRLLSAEETTVQAD